MFRCNTSFWDGSAGRYYEEGKTYDLDLEYHTKLGTLKRFDIPEGTSEISKPVVKTTKKRGTK